MILLYKYEDKIYCNSRDGFDNSTTKTMYQLLNRYNLNTLDILNLVVEVISPETFKQIEYKDTELRLITAYYKLTGTEISYESLKSISQETGIPIVRETNMTWEELFNYQKHSKENTEGFVLRFQGNLRVKLKSEYYLKKCEQKFIFN